MMCKHTYESGTCQKLHKKTLPPKPPIKLTLKRKFELSKPEYDTSTEEEISETEEEPEMETQEEKPQEIQENQEEQEVKEEQEVIVQPIVIEDSNSGGLPPVIAEPMDVQVNRNNAGTKVSIFPQEKVHRILQNSGKRKRPPKTSSGNTARQKLVKVWLWNFLRGIFT